MKVALINPLKTYNPPFALLYLSAILKANGCSVRVFDGFEHYYSFPDPGRFRRQLGAIADYSPELIGISFMSAECKAVPRLISGLKHKLPGVPVICGGIHSSVYYEQILKLGADFVCVGEGEDLIIELLEAWKTNRDYSAVKGLAYNKGGDVVFTGRRTGYVDINNYPLPDYGAIDYQKYIDIKSGIPGRYYKSAWIQTSRGCPGKCIYCSNIFMKKLRLLKMERVVEDIEYQLNNYSIDAFNINDDLFIISEKRLEEFAGIVTRRNLELKYGCCARVNIFNRRIAELLKNSGCVQVVFGIESGSQKILDYYRKGVTVEQTRRALQTANRFQLPIYANIILNGLNESESDYAATVDILKSARIHMLSVSSLTALPGTELFEMALSRGWLPDVPNYEINSLTPELCVNISSEELRSRINKIYARFFPGVIVRTLISFSSREWKYFLADVFRFIFFHPADFFGFIFYLAAGNFRKAEISLRKITF